MKMYVTQKQFCVLSRTLETYYFDTRWIEMWLSTCGTIIRDWKLPLEHLTKVKA